MTDWTLSYDNPTCAAISHIVTRRSSSVISWIPRIFVSLVLIRGWRAWVSCCTDSRPRKFFVSRKLGSLKAFFQRTVHQISVTESFPLIQQICVHEQNNWAVDVCTMNADSVALCGSVPFGFCKHDRPALIPKTNPLDTKLIPGMTCLALRSPAPSRVISRWKHA